MLSIFFRQVYDYDWAFRDDFMGGASISLVRLELDRDSETLVTLSDPQLSAGKQQHQQHPPEYLGQIELALRLEPKRSTDRSSSILSALSHAERQASTFI